MSGPGNSLTEYWIGWNNIARFPSFKKIGGKLMILLLRENPITEIASEDLEGLDSIILLDLSNTALTTLPDFSSIIDTLKTLRLTNVPLKSISGLHAAYLGQIRRIDLGSTDPTLTSIPNLCLSPTTTLDLRTFLHLDLCHCDMVWLKQAQEAGINILYTDQNCAAIGKMWSSATSQELFQAACSFSGRPGCIKCE